MTLYSCLLTVSSATGLVLAAIVYMYGTRKPVNISLAAYNLVFSLWCFGQLMGELSPDTASVMAWTRFNLASAVLIPFMFLVFVRAFLGQLRARALSMLFWASAAVIFIALIPSDLFITGLASTEHFRYYPKGGPAYFLFALCFILQVGTGFAGLVSEACKTHGRRKDQVIYIIAASLVGFCGGILWFLPAFGVSIYPVGIFIMPWYAAIAAYAILKHKLLDISIIITRGIVYSVLVALFSAMYFILLSLAMNMFEKTTRIGHLLPAALTLFCFAIVFDPLRNGVQGMVDRFVFRDRHLYQKNLEKLAGSLGAFRNTDDFSGSIIRSLKGIISADSVAVYLINEGKSALSLRKNEGFSGAEEELPIDPETAALPAAVPADEVRQPEMKRALDRMGASAVLPLISEGSTIGAVLVGGRRDGRDLGDTDVKILSIFAGNASVAAENALLCEEIARHQFMLDQAQRSSSLGSVAAGLAHEIKNPLAAMKGMVHILPENISDRDFMERFEDIIPRQIDRINSTVDKILKLSAAGGTADTAERVSDVHMEPLIDEALSLLRIQCEKCRIKVEKEYGGPLVVRGGRELLSQAVLNMLLNSLQAMPEGGSLAIKTGSKYLSIKDDGCGIRKEDMPKIFDPFFTTKKDGTGLGLSTTLRIIKGSGGSMDVKSEPGQGASFMVQFS